MPIPLFRTKLSPEAIEAAVEVLESGWLGQGRRVAEFEGAFAEYVGANHCVAVASGTAALHLALRVLDLPEGAEVVTTPMTWVSTHYAILYEHCVPVLADIDPATGNAGPAEIERRITDRTGAILVVHYCGYPADLDEIYGVAERHGLPVVEDCAHAAGATYRGRRVGAAGTLQCFSFGPIKNLTMVHGGAVTTTDGRHVDRLRALRSMGFARAVHERLRDSATSYRRAYELAELGFRYELPDVHAAIGRAQLGHLDEENTRRREIAHAYAAAFRGLPGVSVLEYEDDRESAYHMYPILVDDRDRIAELLHERSVDVGVHYPLNVLLPHGGLPHAEAFAARTLTLPIHPWMTEDEVETVVRAVRAA
jgi:perosamine synthetase